MLKADPIILEFLVAVAIVVRSRFPRVPSSTLARTALGVAGDAAAAGNLPKTREAIIDVVAAATISRLVAGGAA